MALEVESPLKATCRILPAMEAAAFFDQAARHYAGMSGSEFIAKWDAGDYDDADLDATPEGRNIITLRLLMPFGRQLG